MSSNQIALKTILLTSDTNNFSAAIVLHCQLLIFGTHTIQTDYPQDLEGYFENLASQGFQNNSFSRASTEEWGLAPTSGVLTF